MTNLPDKVFIEPQIIRRLSPMDSVELFRQNAGAISVDGVYKVLIEDEDYNFKLLNPKWPDKIDRPVSEQMKKSIMTWLKINGIQSENQALQHHIAHTAPISSCCSRFEVTFLLL